MTVKMIVAGTDKHSCNHNMVILLGERERERERERPRDRDGDEDGGG